MDKLLIFLTIIIILPLFLQYFLSKTTHKYPGLIIPILSFMMSLLTVLGLGYTNEKPIAILVTSLYTLIISNIPTVIFIGIYLKVRDSLETNKRVNRDIDKMNIKDL
jgi:hypothetical protein